MARTVTGPRIRFGTNAARWVIAATVLGSGVAFLDSTVVNVALPSISREFHAGLAGLQWVVDGYLVALTALLLIGGSLGDLFGRRRMFIGGLIGFVAASLLCGLAPSIRFLVVARVFQGIAAALLVPGSLAIISACFDQQDRGRAIGAWSGLVAIAGAAGPFVGGWLIDSYSWRLIFLINLPVAGAAALIALKHVPESRDDKAGKPDLLGALCATAGLGGLAYMLIERQSGFRADVTLAGSVGAIGIVAFPFVERRQPMPMVPLGMFRSAQFAGANLTTLAVYAGLGGALFLVVLQLQLSLGYSALQAGGALMPITALLLLLSSRSGRLAQRTGPRLPMTVGPLLAGVGLLLLSRIDTGAGYVTTVLPGAVGFGLGMSLTVAPLTATVLAAVEERHLGVGSGVNNAVARLASLMAVAVLPGLAGIDIRGGAQTLHSGFPVAMRISAAVCASGGLVAWLTIRRAVPVTVAPQAGVMQPCHEPAMARGQSGHTDAGRPSSAVGGD